MIPQADPENPQMISQGPSLCIFNKKDSGEVMASWLFTQYLLTNKVQIAYAETEGYVPVTVKAQADPSYQDYLSRCGEDNGTHYDVKIKASSFYWSMWTIPLSHRYSTAPLPYVMPPDSLSKMSPSPAAARKP